MGLLQLRPMSFKLQHCPDNFLRCLPKSERKGLFTPDEIAVKQECKREKDLHRDIENLLRQRNLLFIHAPMNRKSQLPIGWPDFSILLGNGRLCFVEVKSSTGKLDIEQHRTMGLLMLQGYDYIVAKDLVQVQAALNLWGGKNG
jgi:hypothetical protein